MKINLKMNVEPSSLSQLEMMIDEDFEILRKSYCSAFAQCAANLITEKAKKTIIQEFYNKYTPDYYVRTDNLKDYSWKRYYYHKSGTDLYIGGVKVDPSFMFDYPRKGDDKEVAWSNLWGDFETKWHNKSNNHSRSVMEKFLESKGLLNAVDKAGVAAAKKQSYNFLKITL